MLTKGTDGVYLDVHVQPNARRPGVKGMHGEKLKLAVSQPADGGKANREVVSRIAEVIGVAKSEVELVAGTTSRAKRLFISGADLAIVEKAIRSAIPDRSG